MCEECKKLVESRRPAEPHRGLEETGAFGDGRVDRTVYRCKECGQNWGCER